MKDKIFNERNDKIMKKIATSSNFIAVFSLLLIAILVVLLLRYTPGLS